MDELDFVKELRASAPPADPAVLDRARATLVERANGQDRPRRFALGRIRPRLVLGGAAFSAAAASVLAFTLVDAGTASAATVLNRAAAEAGGTHPGTGNFAYVKWVKKMHNGSSPLYQEEWAAVDGSALSSIHVWSADGKFGINLKAGVCTGPDLSWSMADPAGASAGTAGTPGSPNQAACEGPTLYSPTYDYLRGLPTDPAALRATIYAQVQDWFDKSPEAKSNPDDSLDQQAYLLISTVVTQHALPPDLLAAFFHVATTIPEVSVVNDATDAEGRHGIGVQRSVGGHDSVTLIFDKRAYQVLGQQAVFGGIQDSTALLATGIVARDGQRP